MIAAYNRYKIEKAKKESKDEKEKRNARQQVQRQATGNVADAAYSPTENQWTASLSLLRWLRSSLATVVRRPLYKLLTYVDRLTGIAKLE